MSLLPNPPVNMTDYPMLVDYVNGITGGYFGISILIMLGAVIFISLKDYSTDKAFGITSTILFILTIMMRFLGIISDSVFYFVLALTGFGIIWLIRERQAEEGGNV